MNSNKPASPFPVSPQPVSERIIDLLRDMAAHADCQCDATAEVGSLYNPCVVCRAKQLAEDLDHEVIR